MNLDQLVPPPELCVKIPMTEFRDSYAAYVIIKVNMDKPLDIFAQEFRLMPRKDAEQFINSPKEAQVEKTLVPAPMLPEIMAELPELTEVWWSDFKDGERLWTTGGICGGYCKNPAEAAIREWFYNYNGEVIQ